MLHKLTSYDVPEGRVQKTSKIGLSVLYSKHVYPLPSNRQHLSYDVCLEVRGEIIRTVLCCIVY